MSEYEDFFEDLDTWLEENYPGAECLTESGEMPFEYGLSNGRKILVYCNNVEQEDGDNFFYARDILSDTEEKIAYFRKYGRLVTQEKDEILSSFMSNNYWGAKIINNTSSLEEHIKFVMPNGKEIFVSLKDEPLFPDDDEPDNDDGTWNDIESLTFDILDDWKNIFIDCKGKAHIITPCVEG